MLELRVFRVDILGSHFYQEGHTTRQGDVITHMNFSDNCVLIWGFSPETKDPMIRLIGKVPVNDHVSVEYCADDKCRYIGKDHEIRRSFREKFPQWKKYLSEEKPTDVSKCEEYMGSCNIPQNKCTITGEEELKVVSHALVRYSEYCESTVEKPDDADPQYVESLKKDWAIADKLIPEIDKCVA